jgi:hypothetical protein
MAGWICFSGGFERVSCRRNEEMEKRGSSAARDFVTLRSGNAQMQIRHKTLPARAHVKDLLSQAARQIPTAELLMKIRCTANGRLRRLQPGITFQRLSCMTNFIGRPCYPLDKFAERICASVTGQLTEISAGLRNT